MDAKQFKKIIKEAVKEALQEELINMGKQKLQESFIPREEIPSVKLTTNNISSIREDMERQFKLPPASIGTPVPPTKNPYSDILGQISLELKQNPAEAKNFK